MWKGHPHDAGFNFDENGDECWHEYGCDLGKYHTPAILFEERSERDAAFDRLARFDALESECSDLRMKTTDALTDRDAAQARALAAEARVRELEADVAQTRHALAEAQDADRPILTPAEVAGDLHESVTTILAQRTEYRDDTILLRARIATLTAERDGLSAMVSELEAERVRLIQHLDVATDHVRILARGRDVYARGWAESHARGDDVGGTIDPEALRLAATTLFGADESDRLFPHSDEAAP